MDVAAAGTNERIVAGDLDHWRQGLADVFVELEMEMLEPGRSAVGHLYPRSFGDLTFIRSVTEGCRHRVRRTAATIARSRHRNFFIGLLLGGEAVLEQDTRRASLKPGDIVLFDSTHEYSLDLPRRFEALWISVPRHRLEARLPRPMEVMAHALDGDHGIGHIASVMLSAALREAERLDPAAANGIANHLLDLVSQALLDDAHQAPRRSPYRDRIADRIRDDIEAHLDDETLSVAALARRHGISVRYLSRLFKDEGVGIARWIRLRRLERCRALLQDPAGRRGISEIALSAGFRNVTSFNRLFKQTYGCTPGALRSDPR